MTKPNEPTTPLPPAWKLLAHEEEAIVVQGTDRTIPVTTYQRHTDNLRVVVSDDVTTVGIERNVSASTPHGPPSVLQSREVRRLFLKPDLPFKVHAPVANRNVERYTQLLEGTKEPATGPSVSREIVAALANH